MSAPAHEPAFHLHRGHRPLLVSVPHAGRFIPPELRPRFVPRALDTEDTDWFVDELYGFAREMGASLLVPRASRYVVDLNRPPENTPLYPGVNNTELVPTRFFTGEPLYREGQAPDAAEVARRVRTWWAPYHAALHGELVRLKGLHGHALLFDAHSIKSQLPWLFEGRLPDLNLGTASGTSCDPGLRAELMQVLERQTHFSHVTDGRFKGGYITRHHGRPHDGVHAVQLEKCWCCYMDESPPFALDAARRQRLEPVLRALVRTLLDWQPRRPRPG
ncbi:MAG: N-formylglutamate deformylase [Rhizobacter sp.]|nr:N-formylglutamate deformylase [Rhizobacter sp.]